MSMWNEPPIEELIEQNVPLYGLAPRKWLAQVEEIRKLPEPEPPKEEAT
jgi:hypothetical protein